jgi:class 3 adenylate cyclase
MLAHPSDEDAAPMDEHDGPTHYVIRVRGVLGDRLLIAFPGLRSRTDGGDTLLAGMLSDQAALHGVLAQIEALRLELVEVRRSKR